MASLLKLTNNAITRLNASILSTATTIPLVPGNGALLPSLGAGEYFPCTLQSADGTIEIVKVTARSGDNLTVVRAQEGTTAHDFSVNDRCELRLTAGALQAELDRLSGVVDGYAGAIAGKQNILGFTPAPINSPAFTGQVLVPEGTSAVPGLSFANDGAPDTGFYHIADGVFGISNNTNQTWRFAADGTTAYSFLNVDTSSRGANYTTAYFQNTNGLNITLQGDGPNPYKTLRLRSGTLSFVNSAYTAQIWSLTDTGDMDIARNFSALTVTETSDERKKTNWRPLTDDQLDALSEMDLVGVFDWIDGSGSAVGASAQQIQAIVPWAVHEKTEEDGSKSLTVAYGGLAFAMAHGALRRSRRTVA
jgi:hypothetical protein